MTYLPGTASIAQVRFSPVFSATGLTFTGTNGTYPTYNSYYVKAGQLVSFAIQIDLNTVTNFGTGQYKVKLPFTPAVGFNHFPGWVWLDPSVSPDVASHITLNCDTSGAIDTLDLHYLIRSTGNGSPIMEAMLKQGSPDTLTTASKIYVNGTYIASAA